MLICFFFSLQELSLSSKGISMHTSFLVHFSESFSQIDSHHSQSCSPLPTWIIKTASRWKNSQTSRWECGKYLEILTNLCFLSSLLNHTRYTSNFRLTESHKQCCRFVQNAARTRMQESQSEMSGGQTT